MKNLLLCLSLSLSSAIAAYAQAPSDGILSEALFPIRYRQASFVCQNHLVTLDNDGHAIAYSLPDGKDSTFFDLASLPYKPHCNVADIRRYHGHNYLYVTEWNGQRRAFVEDIRWDRRSNSWSSELVQIISCDADSTIVGAGYLDWVIDERGRKIYSVAYKEGTPKNDRKNSTATVICEFDLPDPMAGNVTLHSEDVLRRMEISPVIYVTQDKAVHRGKLYIAAGFKNWDSSRQIAVVDLKTFMLEKTISLAFYNREPEGLDFVKGKVYITYYKDACYRIDLSGRK